MILDYSWSSLLDQGAGWPDIILAQVVIGGLVFVIAEIHLPLEGRGVLDVRKKACLFWVGFQIILFL